MDDNPVNQRLVSSLLSRHGFRVTQALSGEEALRLCSPQQLAAGESVPDLVLLDVMMPGMSGLEVCAKLRENFSSTELPIILVSAKADCNNICDGLSVKANDYVAKPYNGREILHRVSNQLKIKEGVRMEVELACSDLLLERLLPRHVIAQVKDGSIVHESHASVTILFADIVGFTALSASISAAEVIALLNGLFSAFDDLCSLHDVYKIDTIGDCYMVVAGHDSSSPDHAKSILEMGISMISVAKQTPRPNSTPGANVQAQLRIGIHTGPASSGIIGKKVPKYSFFGDSINTASRCESNSYPMAIVVSSSTHAMLAGRAEYSWVSLGERTMKGKGLLHTWLLLHSELEWQEALRARSLEPYPLGPEAKQVLDELGLGGPTS